MSSLRELIERILKKQIVNLPATRILNAGEPKRRYEKLFPGRSYTTIDRIPGADIQADLEDLSGVNDTFDLILCISVLEHTPHPERVVGELKSVLEPGGYIFVSVPFLYHIHGSEKYGDYWRFTPDGIRILFQDFDEVFLKFAKDESGSVALFRGRV